MESEQKRLEEENSQLEDLVQQYMEGTQLSETTLNEDNPLFVVNGRANLNAPIPVRMAGGPTVQDTRAIYSTTQRQVALA